VVRGVSAGRGLDRLRSDLRPAGGRRAYSGRLHARAGQRGADLRRGRRIRGRVQSHDVDRAGAGDAARHQAVHRRGVERRAEDGRAGRPATRRDGRAADDGWRADLRVGARSRRRRMEYRCARTHQTRLCGGADGQAAHPLRRERLPAHRPGQVVPGRATAALGDVAVLARRWRAVLARPVAVRRRTGARPLHRRRRAAFPRAPGGQAVAGHRRHPARIRGHLVLLVARAPSAGQRRSVRHQARRRTGAHALASRVRCGAERRDGLRAAARARARPTEPGADLGQWPLVLPRRAHVPDSRRLADGLSVAARLAAVGVEDRLSVSARARSVCATGAVAHGCAAASAI
jgi:hypothetical protein